MRLASQRFDVLWLAAATALLTLLFFLARLWGSDGRLAAPLDDTFIHFQYARQIAAGHPFEYNTGDAPSSGDSAFIYPFLLAPAFVLGLDDMRALLYADALNFAAHLIAVILLYRIGFAVGGRALGLFSAGFLLLDGRLNWVFLTGMETGVFTAALVAFFWAWLSLAGTRRYIALALIGAFTALLRPEGHVLVSLACLATLAYEWRKKPSRSTPALLLLVPLLVGLLPYAANIATTGHWQYNTAASKSIWYVPYAPLHENISLTAGWAITAMKNTYLGLEVGRAPFPVLAAPLVVLGVGLALRSRRRRFFHALFAATFVLGIGLALLLPPIQFNRYYLPYDFIFYFYMSLGILWLWNRLARRRSGLQPRFPRARFVTPAIPFAAVALTLLPQLVGYFFALGDSARDIYYQQMAFSEWVRRYTPPETRLGVNDTGAHKYLGDRHVMDLIGLTNNYMRGAYFGGWGSVFERLYRLPEVERPTHLLVHPGVFIGGLDESISQSLLTPIYSIRVRNPIITAGDTETLYRVNWEYALLPAGDTHLLRRDEQPLDALNVGDVDDEARHGYRIEGRQPSLSEPKSIVSTGQYEEGGFSLTDSGRRLSGWEEFTVRSVPGKPLVVVARAKMAPGARRNLLVWANGREASLWEGVNERDNAWQEYEYTIPAELITGELTTIRIDSTHDPGGPGFGSYFYWVYEGGRVGEGQAFP